jgi:hypothetical protein
MILLKSSESFQKTRAIIIYNSKMALNVYACMTYPEKEGEIGNRKGKVAHTPLYATIY